MWHARGRREERNRVLVAKPEGKKVLGRTGVDKRII
jgi:hypothetical protein